MHMLSATELIKDTLGVTTGFLESEDDWYLAEDLELRLGLGCTGGDWRGFEER